MYQQSLTDLMPGSPGGRSLRDQRGAAYLRSIAAKGGAATASKHGRQHMQQIGRAGRVAQLRRQLEPRIISYDGEIVLVICWMPPKGHPRYNSRRRRPLPVWIWL